MQFDWDEEQEALRSAGAEFGARVLTEGVTERDRDGTFSRDLWAECAEFGLQGLIVPEAWSGLGHDLLTAVAILERVGYGGLDNGTLFSVIAHAASCAGPIADYGTDAQKSEWLSRLADGSAIGAAGITEPGSNAPVADLFLVQARTGKGGLAGLTCFLVPADTAGLSVGQPIEKMGLRTSPMAEVFFDDCRVPETAVLGSVGSGAMIFNRTMDAERLLVIPSRTWSSTWKPRAWRSTGPPGAPCATAPRPGSPRWPSWP